MELTEANGISLPTSKWKVVKAAQDRILPRKSLGEIKLNKLIDDLQKYTIEETEEDHKDEPVRTTCDRINLVRRHISNFLQQPKFHYAIILLVITDLVVVLIDLVLGMFIEKGNLSILNRFSFSTIIFSLFKR